MKQAIAEFRENAQRDIAAANAQDAAAKQRAQQEFEDVVAGIAVAGLALAAGAAMAAYGVPAAAPSSSSTATHCESRAVLNTVYTDCQ
jgi:orotate phosphoribosyltransferase